MSCRACRNKQKMKNEKHEFRVKKEILFFCVNNLTAWGGVEGVQEIVTHSLTSLLIFLIDSRIFLKNK